MIFDILIAIASIAMFAFGAILHGIGLFVPDAFETALVNLFAHLKYFVKIFPVLTFLEVMTVALTFAMGMLTVKMGLFVTRLLKGSASRK